MLSMSSTLYRFIWIVSLSVFYPDYFVENPSFLHRMMRCLSFRTANGGVSRMPLRIKYLIQNRSCCQSTKMWNQSQYRIKNELFHQNCRFGIVLFSKLIRSNLEKYYLFIVSVLFSQCQQIWKTLKSTTPERHMRLSSYLHVALYLLSF